VIEVKFFLFGLCITRPKANRYSLTRLRVRVWTVWHDIGRWLVDEIVIESRITPQPLMAAQLEQLMEADFLNPGYDRRAAVTYYRLDWLQFAIRTGQAWWQSGR